MKHSVKITLILLTMFFVTQLIGIFVVGQYTPHSEEVVDSEGNIVNVTFTNLPYGLEPPQEVKPSNSLISIMIAIVVAVFVMFILMKYKAEVFLRIWFFVVVTLAVGISFNSLVLNLSNGSLFALAAALPFAFFKIFKRNIIVHNLTELLIYPGIAAIFVPILSVWTVVLLLVLISLYDMYAVWHAGFMQKMAQYQIEKLRLFTGFFVPYIGKKEKKILAAAEKSKSKKIKDKKIKVSVAILGGGDVVFPIILAGVVLHSLGFAQALIVSLAATIALAGLFYISERGKFYPAMPFICAGCFAGLLIAYLI
ncbi:hypothetical protein HY450_00225 [Candidatus Pacearchaeota archaeon]|nr:hypothetical protein [Candidatus Pacearchaeota archaeon]